MEHPILSSSMLISDLLACSPLIAPLLVELHVDCLGCSMNKFCTLEELCRQYKLDLETVIVSIQGRLNCHANH